MKMWMAIPISPAKSTCILKTSSSSSSSVFTSCTGSDTIGSKWGSWFASSTLSVEASCSSCVSCEDHEN